MLDELKMLLREYVARQQLVYDAIQELRPNFFVVHDKGFRGESVIKMVSQYQKVPFIGTWQKYGTWEYFIHGRGCRLTNLISGKIVCQQAYL